MRTEPIAGRYELITALDSGGMGQVWRGYDRVLDREIAVKLIRPDVIVSQEAEHEFVKRFQREARITARIQHHGVPQVYDAGLDSGADRVYLVMEYIRGTTLLDFIDPAHRLPVAWAAAIGAQIATVLSHAHAIPVVHRDLKPGNVLVTGTGMVKVLDFGIAAVLRTDVTRLTATGSPVGTSAYMSPEQIQAAQISPASDLYSLGCVLYELLTGRPVFAGNAFQLMQQHVTAMPRGMAELRPDVPAPLAELVAALLAKSPERRPADAYEVYERLLPFLPAPGDAVPVSSSTPVGVPDPTLLYRRPNAPRPRPELVPASPSPAEPAFAAPAVAEVFAAIEDANSRFEALLNEDRYAQAAEALATILPDAAAVLGPHDRRVLRLRQKYAAVLQIGGDYRRALPEFDALAGAYHQVAGPADTNALECAQQAAYCRAELGETTAALNQLERLLVQVRASHGDAGVLALDLRRSIGVLLLAETRYDEAAAVLEPLHADLRVVYGEEHEESREVADLLERLRLARGTTDY